MSRRPARARPSVTSSAYSRSPPTGRPLARRVTRVAPAQPVGDVAGGRLAGHVRVRREHDLLDAVALDAARAARRCAGARARHRRAGRARRRARGRGRGTRACAPSRARRPAARRRRRPCGRAACRGRSTQSSSSVRLPHSRQKPMRSFTSRIASASASASSSGTRRRWNASRCAVRVPIPGRRESCAIRFSTAGLNTARELCLEAWSVVGVLDGDGCDQAGRRDRAPARTEKGTGKCERARSGASVAAAIRGCAGCRPGLLEARQARPLRPPATPPSFDCARSWAFRSASFTAARTRSSSISGSSGSIASGAILIAEISPAPLAVTVTMPPPAEASTRSLASSSCACASLLHLLDLLHHLVHVHRHARRVSFPTSRASNVVLHQRDDLVLGRRLVLGLGLLGSARLADARTRRRAGGR